MIVVILLTQYLTVMQFSGRYQVGDTGVAHATWTLRTIVLEWSPPPPRIIEQ